MDLTTRILLFYVVLLVSLVVHEAAHALAALIGGDRTAYVGGQVTLNPMPHIRREPMGTVILPLAMLIISKGSWCMGFAHAPYDPVWAYRHPKRAAMMAAAGPLSNILLAALAFLVLEILIMSGAAETIPGSSGAGARLGARLEILQPVDETNTYVVTAVKMATVFLLLNVLLAFINVMPIPPFDGASIVEGFVSQDSRAVQPGAQPVHPDDPRPLRRLAPHGPVVLVHPGLDLPAALTRRSRRRSAARRGLCLRSGQRLWGSGATSPVNASNTRSPVSTTGDMLRS